MQVSYIVRRYGTGLYGLGEAVVPGVFLFRVGNYDLTQEELAARVSRMPKGSILN